MFSKTESDVLNTLILSRTRENVLDMVKDEKRAWQRACTCRGGVRTGQTEEKGKGSANVWAPPSSSAFPNGERGQGGPAPAILWMDAKCGFCQAGHLCEVCKSKVITLLPGWRMNVRGSLELRRDQACSYYRGKRNWSQLVGMEGMAQKQEAGG